MEGAVPDSECGRSAHAVLWGWRLLLFGSTCAVCLPVSGSADGQDDASDIMAVSGVAGFLCTGTFSDNVEGVSVTDAGVETDLAHFISDDHGTSDAGIGGRVCGGKYSDLRCAMEPVKAGGVLCVDVVGGLFRPFPVWREFAVVPAAVGDARSHAGSVCVDCAQSGSCGMGACVSLADADTSLCIFGYCSSGRRILSCADVLFCIRKITDSGFVKGWDGG